MVILLGVPPLKPGPPMCDAKKSRVRYQCCAPSEVNYSFTQQGKFQAFYQYAKTFNSDDFDYEELKNSDYIFMRWKVEYT